MKKERRTVLLKDRDIEGFDKFRSQEVERVVSALLFCPYLDPLPELLRAYVL